MTRAVWFQLLVVHIRVTVTVRLHLTDLTYFLLYDFMAPSYKSVLTLELTLMASSVTVNANHTADTWLSAHFKAFLEDFNSGGTYGHWICVTYKLIYCALGPDDDRLKRRPNFDENKNNSSSGDEILERDVTYHLICLLIYHWTTTHL